MTPRSCLVLLCLVALGPSCKDGDSAGMTPHDASSSVSCPAPTVSDNAGSCTLAADVQLTQTLRLEASTRLNCKGRSILPSVAGVDGAQADSRPSQPEVAILIEGGEGVSIQNCHIGAENARFDFGVVIAGAGPTPVTATNSAQLRNRVLSNVLYVRARGVQTFVARNNQISDNEIDYSGSRAIAVHLHGSSSTLVSGNSVSGLPTPPTMYHRGVPGVDRQLGCTTCGIATLYPTQTFPVIMVIIEGELLQFPNTIETKAMDNVFRENHVASPATSGGGIYVAVRSVNTLVEDNDVSGGAGGIFLAGHAIDSYIDLPGKCSGDSTRYCGVSTGSGHEDHCLIPGIDTASKGTCEVISECAGLGGEPQPNGTCRVKNVDGRAVDSRIVGNRVADTPGGLGVQIGNQLNPQVRDNVLRGLGVGFNVTSSSLELTEIVRNTVETTVGLRFSQGTSTRFGARISLNDVTAATPIDAGGLCRFGMSRSCTTAAECDVDACNPDGRCKLNAVMRCETNDDCTLVNECVQFSHDAELSVGRCELDAATPCSTDADCTVGTCDGEPTRACRNGTECRTSDGRSPTPGLCTGLTSRGACTQQRGNHWARSCADSQGFRDAAELHRCTHDSAVACDGDADCSALSAGSTCIQSTDTESLLVTDSHPYGVPVAATADADLPSTCL